MDHEEIKQHLRLAELGGVKLVLDDESGGLYIDRGDDRELWQPFDHLVQAYNILHCFCERYDAGNNLVTWTLERKVHEECFPRYLFRITTYLIDPEEGTSPSRAICAGMLALDKVMKIDEKGLPG